MVHDAGKPLGTASALKLEAPFRVNYLRAKFVLILIQESITGSSFQYGLHGNSLSLSLRTSFVKIHYFQTLNDICSRVQCRHCRHSGHILVVACILKCIELFNVQTISKVFGIYNLNPLNIEQFRRIYLCLSHRICCIVFSPFVPCSIHSHAPGQPAN